ncbi:MAG: ArnT family glycosyltransferase [Chloroflexia bacterium]
MPVSLSEHRRPLLGGILLGLILIVAAWLRVSGHDWDADQHLNSDDSYVAKVAFARLHLPPGTSLATLLDPARSPLNPRTGGEFYVYGTLPLYLVKATTAGAYALTGDRYFNSYNGTLQTGRVLSGLFDALTALLVFAVGLRLWGMAAGLAASALYALAVLPIQIGHFYITDPFMTTFMTTALLCSLIFCQTGRADYILLAGLACGLALACKLSAAPVLALPVAAVACWGQRARVHGRSRVLHGPELNDEEADGQAQLVTPHSSLRTSHSALRILAGLLALLVLGVLVGALVGDPFAVLDAGSYISVLGKQAEIQGGGIDQWFTRKYVGTPPVLYLGGQMILLGVGPLVGLAGLVGVPVAAARAWRGRWAAVWLLLIGAGAYFASIAFVEIKWVRYLLPLVPYLCLFAVGLGFGAKGIRGLGGGVLLGVMLVSAALGALAVSAIYHVPQTQVAASEWIYGHLPAGSRIGIEVTTIELPLPLPGHPAPDKEYRLVQLDPLSDQPSAGASAALRKALSRSAYLVIDATQAMLTVPRLPWRYPVQIRYYDLLAAGRLGFAPAAVFTSYPSVLGIQIPDDGGWVDASLMDSSHPPIRIFKKTRFLSDAEWDALFAEAVSKQSIPTRRAP